MRVAVPFLAITLLAPAVARAQTAADGLEALVGGDDAAAVRILRPLAEDTEPDPLAAFLMGTLYHSGRGVAMDHTRACGMYLRAALPASPLRTQSLTLAHTIHQDHPLVLEQCVAASTGRWVEPPAAWFGLGPEHWVQINRDGFIVGYQGTQKRATMTLGGIGLVYHPTRHTQLDVARPFPHRRHFIEFFMWMPHPPPAPAAWTLFWSVYEIVGLDARAVRGGPVAAAIPGNERPERFAIDEAVRLQVNDTGEVEWVAPGANPASGIVPSGPIGGRH